MFKKLIELKAKRLVEKSARQVLITLKANGLNKWRGNCGIVEFVDRLPAFWKFNHKKMYFMVFDEVNRLTESEKATLEKGIPNFIEKTRIALNIINTRIWVYSITVPLLGLLALNYKGTHTSLSLTFLSLSLMSGLVLIYKGAELIFLRKYFVYSGLMRDVFSDNTEGKSREDILKVFETLDELLKCIK